MNLLSRFDARSIRVAIALAVLGLVIFASVAVAAGGGPTVLPVEPDGGIGGGVIVLPVEPDGGIGN